VKFEELSSFGLAIVWVAGCGATATDVRSAQEERGAKAAASEEGQFVDPPPLGEAFGGEDPGVKRELGRRAWAYVPPRKDFPGSELSLLTVAKQDGTKVTFFESGTSGKTFEIPQAFAMPAQAPKVAVGDLVLASFLGNAECARVRAIDGAKIEVAFLWGASPKREQVAADEIWALRGDLAFGAPALFRIDDATRDLFERYSAVHVDARHAWLGVADFGSDPEKKAARRDVEPLGIGRFTKGDAVLACGAVPLGCFETTVLADLHEGLAVEVAVPEDLADRALARTAVISACAVGQRPIARPFGGEVPSDAPQRALGAGRAWVYQPGEGLVLRALASQEGAQAAFFRAGESGHTFDVPVAFTAPPSKAKLAANDLVWVGGRAKGGAACGRVVGASGKDVEVAVVDGAGVAKERVAREVLLPLGKGFAFGAPVVDGSDLLTVVFADEAEAWAFPPSKPNREAETRAPRSRAEVLAVSARLKKGDAVLACEPSGCRGTAIRRVLDDGLRYEVGEPDDNEKPVILPACAVGKAAE
jgi:hypothetical protein